MAHPASPRAFTRALVASTALVGVGLVSARAEPLPTGGQVVSGAVTIGTPQGNALAITQSSQTAIVNWQGFSVGQGHRVDIHQPNAGAAILNRVTGQTRSTIAGQLNANGQVYLVNPNGVTITRSGQVNAAGFVASSLGITDEDFKAGRRRFRGSGASAPVTNHGAITIGRGGYAALIGGQVTNTGTISVPLGRVGLGSGERATLDLSGDGFLQVAVPTKASGRGALVRHSGTISADGGAVMLSAAAARDMARQAVNLSGVVEARSVAGHNGSITLSGDDGAVRVAPGARLDASGLTGADGGRVRISGRRLDVAGTVDVSGAVGGRARLKASDNLALSGRVLAEGRTGRGGRVVATAPTITTHAALIDAAGAAGGGVVRVGGGRLGQGPLARAERVMVDAASTIRADATVKGDGGDVVVWSDGATRFAGTITARGGAQGGNGGEAEVSSKGVLSYDGRTILTAAKGAFGTLLLDPYNITIANAADSSTANGAGGFAANADDSVLGVATLQTALANANVTVSTGAAGSAGGQAGTITLAAGAPLAWNSGATLTLQAAGAVTLNSAITAPAGGLKIEAGASAPSTATADLAVARFTLASGDWVQNAATLPGFATGDFQVTGGAFLRAAGGAGTSADPYRLTDIYGVQGMGTSAALLSANYRLAGDVDASGTAAWNGGAGFSPVGTNAGRFTGSLDGAGRTITGLTVARPTQSYVGLIGALDTSGRVRGLGLVGGSVTGVNQVGGLIGYSAGGAVSQSYAGGSVSGGGSDVGGLVGLSTGGTVSQSYASGSVTGSGDSVGGLVGRSYGTVSQSYASGSVTGSVVVGGLVGENYGTVSQSYASGSVSGTHYMGGLIGQNLGTLTNAFWDTQTTGRANGDGTGSATGATGLTTAQARTASSYAGFDFGTVWYQAGDMRPILRAEAATADANGVIAVSNLNQLQLMGANLAGSYRLAANLDASATSATAASPGVWGAGGFMPVGTRSTAFTGSLDGAGRTITGLTIARPSDDYVGLIGNLGASGSVSGLGLVGGSVSGGNYVGGLVGHSTGMVSQSYANGSVSSNGDYVGGLVGLSDGTVSQSYASGSVSGGSSVGGLVGWNYRMVSQSYASGSVSAGSNVGGLVGLSYGRTSMVSQSYASGSVSGGGSVGGLVGYSDGTVSQSYASGNVSGIIRVGGLAGQNLGTLTNAYWDTQTTGQANGTGFGSATGATGLTTAQLTAALPTGFDAGVWANVGNRTSPYLTANPGPVLLGSDGTGRLYTLVSTLAQLRAINANLGGAYALANDIDAAGTTFTTGVIASGNTSFTRPTPFSGRLDGLGHAVRNLIISGGGNNYVGLIGYSTGIVRDIGVVGGTIQGSQSVGGVVGHNIGGTVTRSYANVIISGSQNVGGLVGANEGGGTVSQSYATGPVTAAADFVGGLVGTNTGLVSQAYATGNVRGSSYVGGLVGYSFGGTVSQSYATGAVSGSSDLGGLVGLDFGGMGTITASVWDTQTSGQTSSAGGVGYTTHQLQGLDPVSGSVAGGNAVFFSTGTNLAANGTSAFAGGANGLYPYLTSFFPNGVQAVAGTAYRGTGATPAASGAGGAVTVGLDAAGARLGQATTGANGYYYIALPAGTLTGGTRVLASTPVTGDVRAAATLTSATGTPKQAGLDLYGGFLTADTSATSLSQAPALSALQASARTAASRAGTVAVNATTGAGYLATGTGFTIDQTVSGSLLVRTAAGAPLTVAAPVTVGGGSLGLLSGGALRVNAPVQARGAVAVTLGYDASDVTNLSFAQGAGLTFLNADGSAATAPVSGQALTIGGQGYTLVRSMADLDGIDGAAAVAGGTITDQSAAGGARGRYALARDLDASGVTYTDALVGTSDTARFGGTFEGLGHTIAGLTIDKPASNNGGSYAGLFGATQSFGNVTVRDIGLLGGSVAGTDRVGGLVGFNQGTVVGAYASGRVSGGRFVGGLVGQNENVVTQAYATGAVSGSDRVGGLVGQSGGSVSAAYATGSVTGTQNVGGLVGWIDYGSVEQSYATGLVSGAIGSSGGLLGYSDHGGITQSLWDTQTAGLSRGIGGSRGSGAGDGVTAFNARQLQGLDPVSGSVAGGNAVFFSTGTDLAANGTSAFAGGANGLYPYLTSFFPNGVQAVTGTAQTTGGTPASGAQVRLYAGGSLLGGGTVSAGSNGYVYQAVAAGTLVGSGPVRIGASLTPVGATAPTGLLYTDAAALAGSTFGLGAITAGQNRQNTAQLTYGGLQADLAATFGAGRAATLTGALTAAPLDLTATGASFTLDRSLIAGGNVSLTTIAADAWLTLGANLSLGVNSLTLASAGQINQDAGSAITAGRLSARATGGFSLLGGGGNRIATVTSLDNLASGDLYFLNADAVTIGDGQGGGVRNTGLGELRLGIPGGLTLAPGARVTAVGDIVLSTPGAFVNNAGANAVASSGGRWLIYSAASAGNIFGGLDSGNTGVWGIVPADGPTVAQVGNRYVFAERPTLTVTTTDLAKTYGEDAAARVAGAYTLTGLRPAVAGAYRGDTLTGTSFVTSRGAGVDAAVLGGGYALDVTAAALGAPSGYDVRIVNAGRLTVDPATITITGATGVDRVYDGTTGLAAGAAGYTVSGILAADAGRVGITAGAVYDQANAGSRSVLVTGLSLTGAGAGNYRLSATAVTGSGTITPRPVTLSGTRVYDAGTGIDGGLLTVGNRVNGDLVTLTGTGTLAGRDVGIQALADLTGLNLSNANYTLAGASGAVRITPARLSYIADRARRDYGGANPVLTGRVEGFLGADTQANATVGPIGFTTTAGTGNIVGAYAISGSGLSATNGNYVFVQAAGNATALTIDPAEVTVTGTRTYDATTGFRTGQLTVVGGVNGETVTLTAGSGSTVSADAGTYGGSGLTGLSLSVAGGNGSAANYRLPATGTLAITAAPVIVTARSGSSVYGDTPTDPGVSASGLVGGQDASVLTGLSNSFSVSARTGVANGPVTLTVAGMLANRNYIVSAREAGTWTITPRALVVTPDALTRAYGDATPARGSASGSLVNDDRIGDVALLTSATAASDVGRYALTATDARFAAGDAANYAITYATRGEGLSVVPRTVSVTAQAQARVYGDANPSLTYTLGGRGLVNGDGLGGALVTDANAASGVGRYAIGQGSLAASANYAVTYQGADLTVTPRPVALSGTRVYDAGTGIVGGLLTVENRVNGDTVAVSGTGTLAGPDVGSRAITDVAGLALSNANYTLAGASGGVTITPATLTYVADAARRTYGAVNPALTGTVTGFLGTDTLADATTGSARFTTAAGTGSHVGAYAVTGAGLSSGNYVLVQAAANADALTIDPAALTVAGTKTYDATTDFGFGRLTVSGGVNSETVTLTAGAGTAASADAGTYGGSSLTGLRLSVSGGSGSAANYRLPTTGTLAITPATVDLRVNDGRSVYGDRPVDPGFSASGLVGGQSVDVLTGLSTGFGLDAASAAGRTTLTVAGRLTNGNYRIGSVTAGIYTIDRRPITVTADTLGRVYGDADPTLTYTIGGRGLANGDRLTGALATAAGRRSDVGTYAIGQGTLAASANYALTYREAELAVIARPITVLADPQTRYAGTANPSLTYTVGGRGLVAGDRLTGTLATTAEADSEPGLYRINQGSLTASANYALGFVGADLTVLAAPTQPRPLPVALDAGRFASTAERVARLDARPVNPELPLLLGAGTDGRLVAADPRFDATLVCTASQGGCFLAPLPRAPMPAAIPAPRPQASLPATAR